MASIRWLLITSLFSLSVSLFAQDQKHVFVFLSSNPDKAIIPKAEQAELQAAHMKNIDRLVAEGKMVVAGPFDGGGGIFIFNSGNVAEVQRWLETDPAVRANRWHIEMLPIRFLKGGACLAGKPYEMVSYKFIRVSMINDIANYKMNQGDLDVWRHLKNMDRVIMVGTFPQSDGGIIAYVGDTKEIWFENQQDMVSLEHKILWVAKGSFCE